MENERLSQVVSAKKVQMDHGVARLPAPTDDRPYVKVSNLEGRVGHIDVHCCCGQHIRLDCEYGESS